MTEYKPWMAVGVGWQPIVQKAVEDIYNEGGTISQIKEKFGGLRLYANGNDKVYDICDKAEKACDNVCEDCGKPGKKTSGGWIRTLCEECNKET